MEEMHRLKKDKKKATKAEKAEAKDEDGNNTKSKWSDKESRSRWAKINANKKAETKRKIFRVGHTRCGTRSYRMIDLRARTRGLSVYQASIEW